MGEVVRPNGGRRSDAGRESSLWAGGRVAGTAGSVVHGRLLAGGLTHRWQGEVVGRGPGRR